MANANPSIDEYIDDHDLDQIPLCEPHEQLTFDEAYMSHSLESLFDEHSSIKLRWDVIHWVFTIPFVSRQYADVRLHRILQGAVDRFKQSIDAGEGSIDESSCFSVDVSSLKLKHVSFRVTSDFRISPLPFSFEAVCMRLQVDPEEMRQHVKYMMHVRGIDELIEKNAMAVRAKCQAPECEQLDLAGKANFSDLKMFIPAIAVPGLVRRKPAKKVVDQSEMVETLDLFTGS